jgi:hypothetical protein
MTAGIDIVRAAWVELLGGAEPAPGDDFYAGGGHSLLLLALAERLGVPAHRLMADPTLAGMAAALEAPAAAPTSTAGPGHRAVPTSLWQARALELARQDDGLVPAAYAFVLHGTATPDPARIGEAVRAVIRRHGALRTFFPAGSTLVGRMAEPADVDCPLVTVGPDGFLAALRAPFDPAEPSLMRAVLLERPDGYTLGFAASDLVMDPWSVPAFVAALDSATGPLGTEPSDFAAVAATERTWIGSPEGRHAVERAAADWTASPPPPAVPPGEPPVPPEEALSAGTVRRIARLGKEHRVTPFALLTAAALHAVRDLTGRSDPAVLVHLARRDAPHLIGPHEDLAPLRLDLEPGGDLARTAQRVRDAAVPTVPYPALARRLAPIDPPWLAVRMLPGRVPSGLGEFAWVTTGRRSAAPAPSLTLAWSPGVGGTLTVTGGPGALVPHVARRVHDALFG